jgi:hypothetical protein
VIAEQAVTGKAGQRARPLLSLRADPCYALSMNSPKASAEAMIRDLPEDATYDDIQYHLYVQQVIEDRLAAVDRGEVVTHDEAKRRMAKWLYD